MKLIVVLLLLLFSMPHYNTKPKIDKISGGERKFNMVTGISVKGYKTPDRNTGFTLMINDTLYNPKKGEFLLMPGIINKAVVKFDESIHAKTKLQVKVVRKLPDGRRIINDFKVRSKERSSEFDLGPFGAAPEYDYEAGEVFVRGYQLSIIVMDNEGRQIRRWEFKQGLSKQVTTERIGMGEGEPPVKLIRMQILKEDRQLFDPKFGSMPLFTLRLSSRVLSNQDDVRILVGLNEGESPEKINAMLRIIDMRGKEIWSRRISLGKGAPWNNYPVKVSDWLAGDYKIELHPVIGNKVWPGGSTVIYRRRETDKENILVSPLANWMLKRDKTREDIRIDNFLKAHNEWGEGEFNDKDWELDASSPDKVSLVSRGDYDSDPVVFRIPAKGFYAVFVKVEDQGCMIQLGEEELIRAISPGPEVFVAATDLTDDFIKIYSGSDPQQWDDSAKAKGNTGSVVSIKLMPVTSASVQSFYQEMMNPPKPMVGVNDWAEYFNPVWARLLPDQFKSIVCGQAEIGIRTIGWSIGRSWVEYHSKLPQTTRFPSVPYEEAKKTFDFGRFDYRRRIKMMNEYDPLKEAYINQRSCDAQIWPWLGMNRHYGITPYGGMFSSKWFKENSQWWQWQKNAESPRGSAVSYFFPEVRKERLDIFFEVAERGVSGVLVGTCRQVPMLLYHPEMVKTYKDETGIDPLKLDISDGESYINWIRWRADFFTMVLRDLRSGLKARSSPGEEPAKISVRIPSSGLLVNLAQGLDVEQWCKEELVDLLQLDPLEDMFGKGIHNVRPYLELGRQYGVKILGGVGATGFPGQQKSWGNDDDNNLKQLIPGLKRAYGLLKAGVDGIEMYETEMLAITYPVRFLVAMYGNQQRLKAFLENSNLEAVAPVGAGSAMAGYDNHSNWRGSWTLEGLGGNSL